MTNLFQVGRFQLHSGEVSRYKIDCDALTSADWDTLAEMIAERVGKIRSVSGVPTGGAKLAAAIAASHLSLTGCRLIVDDVLTTGASMEECRETLGEDCVGAVVFARRKPPDWVTALFEMTKEPCDG